MRNKQTKNVELMDGQIENWRKMEKKIKLSRVIEAIESGDYIIDYTNSCGCNIDWGVNNQYNDELGCECSGDDCWQGHVMKIDDVEVAQNLQHESIEWLADIDCDGYDINWNDYTIDWYLGDQASNPAHDAALLSSLGEYCQEMINDGYQLYYIYGAFANDGALLISKIVPEADHVVMTPVEFAEEYYRYIDNPITDNYQACHVED